MALPIVPYSGPIVTRAEAKANGLKRYFMGPDRPCKYGHVSERSTVDGCCILCARTAAMSPEQLENKRRYALKYDEANRAQKNERSRALYKARFEADPEAMRAEFRRKYAKYKPVFRAANDRWQAKNIEHLRAYREANKDKIAQTGTAWQKANPERVAAKTRAWHARNPGQMLRWRKANPEAAAAAKHRRRAREREADGSFTAGEVKALFDRQRGKCAGCSVALRKGYHIDHIVPLAGGGTNWITNIQLLCGPCNVRKGATDPLEYARRTGRLL
jgi:5-methylcytosine-specific restriction endonuclease McrA